MTFDPSGSELQIRWRSEVLTLGLAGGSGSGLAVDGTRLAPAELSAINQQSLSRHTVLVKLQKSVETGRQVRDSRVQKCLELFLLTNPSVAAFHDFLPSIQDSLDFEELMKIDFPSVIEGRNKQDTARWGVDKFVDQSEIEEMLACNPTTAQMNALLREK